MVKKAETHQGLSIEFYLVQGVLNLWSTDPEGPQEAVRDPRESAEQDKAAC